MGINYHQRDTLHEQQQVLVNGKSMKEDDNQKMVHSVSR